MARELAGETLDVLACEILDRQRLPRRRRIEEVLNVLGRRAASPRILANALRHELHALTIHGVIAEAPLDKLKRRANDFVG